MGQPVIGRDLYGRGAELRRLWDRLGQGEHIHMLAPRPVGKTSLMLELRRKPGAKWHVVYADVEGVSGPAEWVAAVMAELAGSPSYRTWLEAVPFGKSLSDVWQQLTNAQVTSPFLRVELRSAMGNEWPDRWTGCRRGCRRCRRRKVHTLVGGSIGLDGVLRREGLSASQTTSPSTTRSQWNDPGSAGRWPASPGRRAWRRGCGPAARAPRASDLLIAVTNAMVGPRIGRGNGGQDSLR